MENPTKMDDLGVPLWIENHHLGLSDNLGNMFLVFQKT